MVVYIHMPKTLPLDCLAHMPEHVILKPEMHKQHSLVTSGSLIEETINHLKTRPVVQARNGPKHNHAKQNINVRPSDPHAQALNIKHKITNDKKNLILISYLINYKIIKRLKLVNARKRLIKPVHTSIPPLTSMVTFTLKTQT